MPPSCARGRLYARNVVTDLDQLALCLQNASRGLLNGPSQRELKRLVVKPEVMDYLECLVFADREAREVQASSGR